MLITCHVTQIEQKLKAIGLKSNIICMMYPFIGEPEMKERLAIKRIT